MILPFFGDPLLSSRLCLTLLHSLWQAALLTGIALAMGRLARRRSVEREYAFLVTALLTTLGAMPVTFALLVDRENRPHASAAVINRPPAGSSQTLVSSARDTVPRDTAPDNSTPSPSHSSGGPTHAIAAPPAREPLWMRVSPWIAALYGLGVVAMLARLSLGVRAASRLGRRGEILRDGPLVDFVRAMAAKWSLHAVPLLVRVDEIVTPKVVGLVWPRILLPAAAVSGLTPAQLEMVLTHELAHLRRHDMWVNLLQRLAEAVLFFNPAVWYMSRRISTVREFCCDELTCRTLAAAPEQSKTQYALALLRVVELARPPQAPCAATDPNGADDLLALAAAGRTALELRTRIETLYGEPVREPLRLSAGGWLTVAALALAVLLVPFSWRMAARSADKTPASGQAMIQPTPPRAKPNATASADLSRHVVMIEAESRPRGVRKSFPAIVMASSGGKSLLLSASWGAEPFPLDKPGVPIGALFLSEWKNPVGIVAYDTARGIAVFSVNQVLEPVPEECFSENLEKGDLLTSLPLAKGDAKHSTRVLAVEETYASEATDRETVAVKHTARIDSGKWQCGSPMLKDGKIAAIFLNNGTPPGLEKLYGYAVPARYALQAFAELSAERAAPSVPGKIAEPVFIVARQAMIYDGHVVTWDEIRDRIKEMTSRGPVIPRFEYTNGALDKLHDTQQERLQREFDFKETNVGILSPRAGRRYDAVKSQADLSPKPPDARQGSVRVSNGRSHDGSPVVGAQVVLLPAEDVESGGGFTMTLNQGRLRAPYEEIVTETDAAGLFVVYESGRFQLVVLHKDGFAVRTSDEFRNPVIKLEPWVRIEGTLDLRDNPKQSVNFTSTVNPGKAWPPITLIDYDVPMAKNGSFQDAYAPPGDIVVQRHIPGEKGHSYGLAARLLRGAKPGSVQRVAIGPMTAQDQQMLDRLAKPGPH
jgi:beta-lactamase regulating signal transducer with metallopeptidase domain